MCAYNCLSLCVEQPNNFTPDTHIPTCIQSGYLRWLFLRLVSARVLALHSLRTHTSSCPPCHPSPCALRFCAMAYVRERGILAHLFGADVAGLVLEFHQPLTDKTEAFQKSLLQIFKPDSGHTFRLQYYPQELFYLARFYEFGWGLHFVRWSAEEQDQMGRDFCPFPSVIPIDFREGRERGKDTYHLQRPYAPGQREVESLRQSKRLVYQFERCKLLQNECKLYQPPRFQRTFKAVSEVLGWGMAHAVMAFHEPLTENAQRRQRAICAIFQGPPLFFRLHLYTHDQCYLAKLTDGGLCFHRWEGPLLYQGADSDPGSWWLPVQERVTPVGRYTVQFRRPLRLGYKDQRQAVRNGRAMDELFGAT